MAVPVLVIFKQTKSWDEFVLFSQRQIKLCQHSGETKRAQLKKFI